MASGLIGALRVTLGIDTSEFERGTSKAEAQMRRFQREFDRSGKKIQQMGRDMSTYLTLPVLAAGAAIIKTAGDFEQGMNVLQVSAGASKTQMKALREEALKIGEDTSKSASEASSAMDMLAKNGMAAQDILKGGARAAVVLAEATGSKLDPAAAALTDTFQQFKMGVKDLPTIINQITGAVNESKFDFTDFQMGMGQAGAAAGSAGMSFRDFTATLAGTSAMFASGSDAGTSLKTFLIRMTPETKKAATAIADLGLSFYDAQGKMRPMKDIAEQLKETLAGLSDEDRNGQLKAIFGTDAMRTAIGLMNLGEEGLLKIDAAIAKTSATEQAAARMKGFNGEMEKMKGALETLAIRLADSGFLSAVTSVVTALGNLAEKMGKLSPETLKWGIIIAGLVATIGPLLVALGAIVRSVGVILPLLAKLGPVFTVLRTVIAVLSPVLWGAVKALAAMALTPLGAFILLLGAVYLAWKNWDKIVPIVKRMYEGVKNWIGDKLHAILRSIKKPIDEVKGWFYGMYDAVVGNSYVPDMVDEIGVHMNRLGEVMVKPAKKSAEEVKAAFNQLKNDVGSLLERLYPEQAKENALAREIKVLEEGMKKLGFTAEQTEDAIRRLRESYDSSRANYPEEKAEVAGDFGPPVDEEDTRPVAEAVTDANEEAAADTKRTTQEMVEMWADFATDTVANVSDMVKAFKSGDILGGILGFLDIVKNLVSMLAQVGVFKGSSTGGGGATSAPGYSTGGSFKVGGSGGVDSQLVQLRATPGEQVSVRRGDQMDKGRGETIVRVIKGEMFDAHVEKVARPMSEDAVHRGAAGGAGLAARNNYRARRSALA